MQETGKRGVLRYVFYLLLVIGLGGVAFLCFAPESQDEELVNEDKSKALTFLKVKRHLPEGLYLLRSEDMVRVPLIDGFQSPMGGESGAFIYDAQPYGADNAKRGGKHLGEDLNGIGGANSDLDMPVYASARGIVVYQGTPSDDWGLVVIIAHRLPDGRLVQSMYAHLASELVGIGQMVARGEVIGTVGSAGGRYMAHLHFELIESLAMEAAQLGYHPFSMMNRLNPRQLMQEYPAPSHPDVFVQMHRIFLQEAQSSSPHLAPKLPEGSVLVNPSQFLPVAS